MHECLLVQIRKQKHWENTSESSGRAHIFLIKTRQVDLGSERFLAPILLFFYKNAKIILVFPSPFAMSPLNTNQTAESKEHPRPSMEQMQAKADALLAAILALSPNMQQQKLDELDVDLERFEDFEDGDIATIHRHYPGYNWQDFIQLQEMLPDDIGRPELSRRKFSEAANAVMNIEAIRKGTMLEDRMEKVLQILFGKDAPKRGEGGFSKTIATYNSRFVKHQDKRLFVQQIYDALIGSIQKSRQSQVASAQRIDTIIEDTKPGLTEKI